LDHAQRLPDHCLRVGLDGGRGVHLRASRGGGSLRERCEREQRVPSRLQPTLRGAAAAVHATGLGRRLRHRWWSFAGFAARARDPGHNLNRSVPTGERDRSANGAGVSGPHVSVLSLCIPLDPIAHSGGTRTRIPEQEGTWVTLQPGHIGDRYPAHMGDTSPPIVISPLPSTLQVGG
jgi:hypothetical protein